MRTIVVFIILLTVASTGAWSQADTPLVVLLYSYHRAAWSDAVHEGVLSVFGTGDETLIQTADGLATAFLIRTEYMDTKWIESPAYLDSLEELYSAKYGGRKIVAVMAVDDHAYRFAIQRDCFGGGELEPVNISRL
ncbi:MAG TPA: hypothetical protein PLC54_07225, partial [Spirochaetales bacterium]|nr:hypothetical protein [Spirochaetales bacterium]